MMSQIQGETKGVASTDGVVMSQIGNPLLF